MIKNIISSKVSIGFAAALLVVIINTIVADRSIRQIAANNRALDQIHAVVMKIDSPSQRLRYQAKLAEHDQLQAESRQSLEDVKIAIRFSGLLDLLFLVFLYGLVNWDLTKKQQVKSILLSSVAEFEELYHSAPCGYHSVDLAGKIIRINQTELQMLGYVEAEVVGKNIADLIAAGSIESMHQSCLALKTHGSVHDIELQMVRKDGQIVPVSVTVVSVNDANGNYLGSRATVIDISDRLKSRKQAKLSAEIAQKIRQSLQLDEILQTAVAEIQKLLEVDRVLIFKFERDGSGKVVQEKVLTGYPVVMGSKIIDPCFDLSYHDRYSHGRTYNVADITQAGFAPCYVEFLQQFDVKASVIVPIQLHDQLWGLLIVHHCQSPRAWQQKEVEAMSQISTQIGIALAQAQLLEQEQLQRQELARSNAELEQFAHIASHDLQEPLRMVISYLQLLERRYHGKLDRDADEFIDYAINGAVRMQTLIQALLSYARVSSRKQPFGEVDCEIVFQNAISNLSVAIRDSGGIISHDPLPVVWGDATQLTQVFQNLIGNALKFRQAAAPKIHVSAQPISISTDPPNLTIDLNLASTTATIEPPSAWCFAIADNGIGIEPQYLDRIFAIFQRLHTRVTYPGTGIGLAICKKIVERHGGTIWVESTPINSDSVLSPSLPVPPSHYGSVFYFTIPAISSISTQYANKQPHD
ncbi:MAG: GAF domain-containing protein [Chamaesiphon sp.]|nr:GAF domain-containing protein [Chamaesiphon sp.]